MFLVVFLTNFAIFNAGEFFLFTTGRMGIFYVILLLLVNWVLWD
jgi:hypothetical protein